MFVAYVNTNTNNVDKGVLEFETVKQLVKKNSGNYFRLTN